jgi:hypothetical protein
MVNRIIRGESIQLGDTILPLPNVMEEIQDAIDEDPEDRETLSQDLLMLYYNADMAQRAMINATLVAVCGYSLRTLLFNAVADDDIYPLLGFENPMEAGNTQKGSTSETDGEPK